MSWTYEMDLAGIGEYLRTDTELAASLYERAKVAEAFAKAISPVGTPHEHDHHPGHYRESWSVGAPKPSKDRQAAIVENTADYAPAVEADHHVAGRTIAAFSDPKGGPGL